MKTIEDALREMFDLYYVKSFTAEKDEDGNIHVEVEYEEADQE